MYEEKIKWLPNCYSGMGCRGRDTLQFLCDQIPGDALLYSMFKTDAEPIKCPIKGKMKLKIISTN